MDFVEGIGRQYLQRKANAVPQQLENLAKKQFHDNAAATDSDPATQNVGKDKEIEKLRRELAETKRGKGKPEKEVGDGTALVETKTKELKATNSPGRSKRAAMQSTKSASMPRGRARPQAPMHERHASEAAEAILTRGRSSSVQTATATKKPSLKHEKHPKYKDNEGFHGSNRRLPAIPSISRYPPSTDHEVAATASAYRDEQAHKIVSRTISERPRPATDLCLVEVIDEEPQRKRPANRSGRNVVEVVEKDRNRTRYIIR
ncbi:MAG: hypothetical protein Q9188_004988 [Gyalolechia gomerana]